MSIVTGIILTCELHDGEKAVAIINKYLEKHCGKGLLRMNKSVGGSHAMQADVYAGAFNYLDDDEFATVVKSCPFEYPEAVTLFINGEQDDGMWAVTLNQDTSAAVRHTANEIEAKFRELGETPATPFTFDERADDGFLFTGGSAHQTCLQCGEIAVYEDWDKSTHPMLFGDQDIVGYYKCPNAHLTPVKTESV